MYYRIDEIHRDGIVANSTFCMLLVDVSFWPSKADHDAEKPPQWREDFRIQIYPQATRIVKDGRGFWRRASDGRFFNPATLTLQQRRETVWSRETVTTDAAAVIRDVIERYVARNPSKQGDHFDRRVQARKRSDDARGVLFRDEVQEMKRTAREVSR